MTEQQLALPVSGDDGRPPLPRLAWPTPLDGGLPFDDEARFFEPWWPGAQAFLRLERPRLELRVEHLSDPLEAFGELRRLGELVAAERAIISGTLLALDAEGRPDAGLLRRRLTGDASEPATGAFVASDLPWLDDDDLRRKSFADRRRRLAAILRDSDHAVVSRGLVGEGRTLAHAVATLGLGSISARRLDGRWSAGRTSDVWLRLRIAEPTAARTRPFLVLLERLPLGD